MWPKSRLDSPGKLPSAANLSSYSRISVTTDCELVHCHRIFSCGSSCLLLVSENVVALKLISLDDGR